jgi:hypothetical protein
LLDHDAAITASSQGEDVLLSEARIVSEERGTWEPPARPFPVGNFDPRTAIFRAREAYRERVRAKAAAERESAGVGALMGSHAAQDVVTAPEDEARADPGPGEREGAGAAAEELPAQAPAADLWPSNAVDANAHVAEPATTAVAEFDAEATTGGELAIASESLLGEPVTEMRPLATCDEKMELLAVRSRGPEEVDSAGRLVGSSEREALPDWYRADLPRICRTCRDYRPSADGQRGWCANSWAFTHRRLVLEDDPAPCQSAIGDWWLPVDDVWLVAADVSSHGRATPLLDRMTAKAQQQRRRS